MHRNGGAAARRAEQRRGEESRVDGVEIEKRIPEDEGCRIRVVLSAHLFSYSTM